MALEPARDAHRRPQVPPHDEADPLRAQADLGPGPPVEAAASPGPAPWPKLAGALAAARRVRPEAAAAGAIAGGALILALLAGAGDAEFPGPAFEAGLLSRPASSQPGQASQAALASEGLAGRLVEDPAFAGGGRDESSSGLEAAMPPPPDATPRTGSSDDAVAVLSAAVPRPADPAVRLLEQRRTHRASAEGAPREKGAAVRAEQGLAVQLVAVGRREQAVEAWTRLQRDHADLLGRLQPIIVEPERRVSTLYRLRAGPLASPREAQTLCASLVRRAVDCIVVQAGS